MSDYGHDADRIRARIAHDANLRLIDKALEIDAVLRDDPVWRYVMFGIEEEKRAIIDEFARVSPSDTASVTHLQARALAADMLPNLVLRLRAEAKSAEEEVLVMGGQLPIPTD